MATIKQKIDAERKMRDLCEESGLPQPDRIEYGYTCIRLFWEAAKAVIVVDIDECEEPEELSFEAFEQLAFSANRETSELARRPEQRGEDDADDRHDEPDDPALGLAVDHNRGDRDADRYDSAGGDQSDDQALKSRPPDLSRRKHVR